MWKARVVPQPCRRVPRILCAGGVVKEFLAVAFEPVQYSDRWMFIGEVGPISKQILKLLVTTKVTRRSCLFWIGMYHLLSEGD
jgi:hypothetical protein